MTCRDVKKYLAFYREGELSESQQRQVYAHLAECEMCRQEFEEYRWQQDWIQELKQSPKLVNADQLTRSVMFTVRQMQRSQVKRSGFFERLFETLNRTSIRFAVGTAIFMLVGLFVIQEAYILKRIYHLEQRLAQQTTPAESINSRFSKSYAQLLEAVDNQGDHVLVDKQMLQEWLSSYNRLEMSHTLLLKLLIEQENNVDISLDNGLSASEIQTLLENKSLLKRLREL